MMSMPNGAAAVLRGVPGAAPWPREDERAVETRRRVLASVGWSVIALVALQAAAAFVAYFWPRRMTVKTGAVQAGAPADYRVGDVRHFVDGRFYVSRVEEGFVALHQKCPHLGCAVQWMPHRDHTLEDRSVVHGVFRCPCHGSTYLRNGDVVVGPAPRPMDYLPLKLVGDQLVVDTASPKKRERWDPRQALPAG